MWWSSAHNRRRAVKAAALLLVAIGVSACGFRPMYERPEQSAKPGSPALDQVSIDVIKDRSGQLLRNALMTRLHPRGRPSNPRFDLGVELSESQFGTAISTDDSTTRASLITSAAITLKERSAQTAIFNSAARSVASYNIFQSDYATVVAERDARARNVDALADTITAQIALFFNRAQSRPELLLPRPKAER